MALTTRSLAAIARRKAKLAHQEVVAAECELHQANGALQDAIPLGDTKKIVKAANQTLEAEQRVHNASENLDAVDALLSQVDAGTNVPNGTGLSGTGAASLIPHLKTQRSESIQGK